MLLNTMITNIIFRSGFYQYKKATPIIIPSLEKQFKNLQFWILDNKKINFYF